MDEKILALLSAAGGTLASGLVLFGVFREKFRSLLSDVADLKREHVARSDYEQDYWRYISALIGILKSPTNAARTRKSYCQTSGETCQS